MIKSNTLLNFLFSLIILHSFNSFSQDNLEKRPAKEKWNLVAMEGTVTSIDSNTREITVMGPKGDLLTVNAGEEVKRFNEIKVNDIISFEYYTYIKAEFRQPTSEELEEPLVVVAEGGKAPENMDPAAVLGAVVKAVVTVEVINRPEMLVTVKGPRGNYVSIPVEDTSLLEQLHIGEVVVLTYAEAVALSLKKMN